MAQMDNVVEAFSDEEMEDYASVFTQIINDLCRFADKYNYDRDNIMKYTAQRFSVFAEITTVENLSLKERPTIEPKHEWISVRDRLPEQLKEVLVCFDGYGEKSVSTATYRNYFYGKEWLSNMMSLSVDSVTHWMPLPEPPEKE